MALPVPDIIRKKRDGGRLSSEEIRNLITEYLKGSIPDYQISALLMAVFFRGMDREETGDLTRCMMNSGEVLHFDHLPEGKVDKHSTGGIGDKTSLIIAPAVAACGLRVPMISGRGLGITGGTLDKLESIPGFQVRLSSDRITQLIEQLGLALVGQTDSLVPADKKLYALRDVTATVESIPLIVSSIMSKKLAEGIDALVLDVKVGLGAFMKTLEQAKALAEALVETGCSMGKRMAALLTDMNQPLGRKVGNALEIEEVVEVLKGGGPEDLKELCRILAAYMLWLGGAATDCREGIALYDRAIADGRALERFRDLVAAQGGDARTIDHPDLLPQAKERIVVSSPDSGYVGSIHAGQIGWAAVLLGAGRMTVESSIDPSAGIVFHRKTGDRVQKNDPLCELRFGPKASPAEAECLIRDAIRITAEAPAPRPLILERIERP